MKSWLLFLAGVVVGATLHRLVWAVFVLASLGVIAFVLWQWATRDKADTS